MSKNIDNNILKLKLAIKNTKASNKSPLYNNMLYWSQKPYTITDVIIDNLSNTNDIKLQSRIRDQFRLVEQLSTDEIAFMDSIAAKYFDFDLDKLEDGSNVVKALEEYANAGAKLLYEQATNGPDKLIFSILGDFRSLSDPNNK